MMDPVTPSGQQVTIRSGDYEATTTEVGGGLRTLTWRGRPLVAGFEVGQIRTAYRGSVLAPWPNRVVDGKYSWEGRDFRLPLTEPERGHALHGLVVWERFAVVASGDDAVVWAATTVPQPWYPWCIEVRSAYRLTGAGLEWSVSGRNLSEAAAPFGCGIHPYLLAPAGAVDDWSLTLPAAAVQEASPDRLVPGGLSRLAEPPGTPIPLRGRAFDNAFTELTTTDVGTCAASLTDGAGRGVRLSWDASAPWVQVYTCDGMPGAHRRAVAIEPMTCGPDAFNSAAADVRLEPGETRGLRVLVAALAGGNGAG